MLFAMFLLQATT